MLLFICNLVLAIWIAITASHRIISVEHPDVQFLWCIGEGTSNETISWEFENQHLLDIHSVTEIQKMEIWPGSHIFNLSSSICELKNNTNEMLASTSFGPVTDLQWNEFEIEEIKKGDKKISIRNRENVTNLQFSLLSNSSVNLEVSLMNSQITYELRIDSTMKALVKGENITTYRTLLQKIQLDGSTIETLTSNVSISQLQKPELEYGVRWKTFDFFADRKTIRLKSEGRTLIDQPLASDEVMNLLYIKTDGIAKLKVHNYLVAVIECEKIKKNIKGVWTLDGKKRACIEVTYFSPQTNLTLFVNNKDDFKKEITLLASDDWKNERFLSEMILPGGNYTFEIKRIKCAKSVSVIRRIRFCNENEYFIYKISKPHVTNSSESKCHTLASRTSQTLSQKANTKLKPGNNVSSILASFLESEVISVDENETAKSAIVCISSFGCFCLAGWKGANCTEECESSEYGINCGGVCGNCKESICDKFNGSCVNGCRNSNEVPPLCLKSGASSQPKGMKAVLIGIILPSTITAVAFFTVAIIKLKAYRLYKLSNQRATREIPLSVRYGELQHCSASTKETFRSRFENALESGQLKREFESLPCGQLNSWSVGTNAQNLMKNRYCGIAAYDFNRVVLGGESQYINASYIRDHENRSAYIAAQGPKTETLNDFWRMIWQEKVATIVMLGRLVENGKSRCQQYWPPLGCRIMIGNFVVTCNEEKAYVGFVKRTLCIALAHDGCRRVIQLQYEWTRKGLPTDLGALSTFMDIVQSKRQTPIVVHCSGGTGRTCTIILVDLCLRKLTLDNRVDVFKTLERIRRERVNAVENFDQYLLAHKLIMQYLQL